MAFESERNTEEFDGDEDEEPITAQKVFFCFIFAIFENNDFTVFLLLLIF